MKIVVCLKEVIDTTVSLAYGQVSDTQFQKGLSCRLDPRDAGALAAALELKAKDSSIEITLLTLGPEHTEIYLREGLAAGADRAVRVWEDGFQYLSTYRKSRILAGAIKQINADLVLTGSQSLDNAGGLTGPLLAAWLDLPCICEAGVFQIDSQRTSVAVTRNIRKGQLETLQADLPAVLALTSPGKLPYAPVDKILAAQEALITHLTLMDIGLTPISLGLDPTRISGLSFPRPRPKSAPLDSSLPAFYRILALLEGGLTKRRGEMLKGTIDEMVDQLFDLLVKEEIIRPVRK
jgi:electron transfer flavoprotein beta subunit